MTVLTPLSLNKVFILESEEFISVLFWDEKKFKKMASSVHIILYWYDLIRGNIHNNEKINLLKKIFFFVINLW